MEVMDILEIGIKYFHSMLVVLIEVLEFGGGQAKGLYTGVMIQEIVVVILEKHRQAQDISLILIGGIMSASLKMVVLR